MPAARAADVIGERTVMMQSIAVGPLSLPISIVVLAASTVVALVVARRLAGASRARAEGQLYRVLLVALAAARLAFVAQYLDSYLAAPLSMLDIRDGGWQPWAGMAAAWVYVAWRASRDKALRRAMLAGVMAFTVAWVAGGFWISRSASSPRSLPHFAAMSLDGGAASLREFAGKPTVINLWASWCPPCRRELPAFEQVQKARSDVNIVLLNQGEPAGHVQQYLEREALDLRNVLLDADGDVARLFDQRGLPATLFFDADGRLADVRLGELSQATLLHRINALARPAPAPGKAP